VFKNLECAPTTDETRYLTRAGSRLSSRFQQFREILLNLIIFLSVFRNCTLVNLKKKDEIVSKLKIYFTKFYKSRSSLKRSKSREKKRYAKSKLASRDRVQSSIAQRRNLESKAKACKITSRNGKVFVYRSEIRRIERKAAKSPRRTHRT